MMRWLDDWWSVQSARINAMSLRERIFLFTALLAGSMALADTLWLSPAQATYQKLVQQFDKQSTELRRARNELKVVMQSLTQPVGTANGVREEIAAVALRTDAVNGAIKDASPSKTRETPLAQVLVHILRRHDGLTLLHVSTLVPDAALTTIAAPVGSAATVAVALPPGWLTRQGVELTVSGPYPELTRYLEMLENLLPSMRWGTMKLKSEKLPPELTLQLFLVDVKP